ncbi:hypothetical protein TL16_g12880 [Triparma laevis f. inornata]|uniref:Uncharacterized protein n=1 Tax=Triparma laevis f. inornata TaxID=1714386 RepID=A0A9W7BX69_9STRA|nr:hypothetical protein TL16_g12880 [Triparma laevis f. inornata]
MSLTYYTGFGYGLAIFTSFSLLVIFYLFSYKWRSHGHLLFSIDDKKLTEVCATLAGIVGFTCLGTSVLLVVYVVEGEIEHVISLEVIIYYLCLFCLFGVNVEFKKLIGLIAPSVISSLLLYCEMYGVEDFKEPMNGMYVWMYLYMLGGVGMIAVSTHWRTRENLIKKVSKAEKQIKTAKRFFFFGSADTV